MSQKIISSEILQGTIHVATNIYTDSSFITGNTYVHLTASVRTWKAKSTDKARSFSGWMGLFGLIMGLSFLCYPNYPECKRQIFDTLNYHAK